MSRRWRYPRSRRGVFYGPLPSVAPQAPPTYVPAFQEPSGRNARLTGMRVRRGRIFTVTGTTVCPPPRAVRRPAARLVSARRGRFYAVPMVGATPAVAPWIPEQIGPSRRAAARPARRGKFFAIPLTGAPSLLVTAVPRLPSRRPRLLFSRRGRFWLVPPRQLAAAPPWVPPIVRGRRAPLRLTPRCGYLTVPVLAETLASYVPAKLPVGSTRSTDGRAVTRVLGATAFTRDLDGAATTREDE